MVVGMGAIVSDWALVHSGSLIGEGAVVRQSENIPPFKIAVGVPARVTGDVSEKGQDLQRMARRVYVDLARRYIDGLKKL